jgi:hypothetical protein
MEGWEEINPLVSLHYSQLFLKKSSKLAVGQGLKPLFFKPLNVAAEAATRKGLLRNGC